MTKFWYVKSDTSGNLIALCHHLDDALALQIDYEIRSEKSVAPHTFSIGEVTLEEAMLMLQVPWVKSPSNIAELFFTK